MNLQDPNTEYESRLKEWTRRAESRDQDHERMGSLRILFICFLVVLTAALARSHGALGFALTILIVGLFLTGMVHVRIENARDRARRAIRFYQAGMARLGGSWAGKGSGGMEFLDPHHLYAADLDIFGTGSLFELLNAAQTQNGRACLASWLLAPAGLEEIRARHESVRELCPKVDLREGLGLIAAEAERWIRTESLLSWARQPRVLDATAVRVIAFALPFVNLALCFSGLWQFFLVGLAIGVLFSTPAILLTRRMILSGQQTTEGLLWPFRLVMWGIMVGIAIGAVIGDPTGDTVAISAILAVLWVLMIEFLVRRMKARHSS